jgi:hypothetical protein
MRLEDMAAFLRKEFDVDVTRFNIRRACKPLKRLVISCSEQSLTDVTIVIVSAVQGLPVDFTTSAILDDSSLFQKSPRTITRSSSVCFAATLLFNVDFYSMT